MILDRTNEFSDSQAVTATAISANVIDVNPAAKNATIDYGAGEPVWLVLQVDTTFTAAGAATLTASLESAANAALSSGPVVHYTTPALALADLVAGAEVARIRLPRGDYKRYLGMRYTVGTGPMTAGAISAFLVKDAQDRKTYESGWKV